MKKRNGIYLTSLLTALLLWGFYGDILIYPENYLFDNDGDGVKNYFNFSYHVKYDREYWHFGGMNEPYGEYLPYVDCHPALAIAVKWVSEQAIDLTEHTFGLLNFLMFCSIVGGAFFIYLILIRFQVPYMLAIVGATAIAMLSSQVLLWQFGHYALSHTIFFPLGWYLVLRFQEGRQRWWWSALIAIHTISWFFIHAYLGAMLLAFTLLAELFFFLFHPRSEFKKPVNIVFLAIQVAVPLLVVYYLLVVADPYGNRIAMPFLTDHRASIYSVFFPNHSFLRPLYEVFVDLAPQGQQSWGRVGNYIGFPANLALVIVLLLTPYLVQARRWDVIRKLFPLEVLPFLLAAFLLLLFAMAIPFKYGNLRTLLDLVPPLKQFAALGRFAWPFYYVITVYTLVLINSVFTRGTANVLLFLASLVFLGEGASYHRHLAAIIGDQPNFFRADVEGESPLSGIGNRYDFINFQAILPLPFFHKYTTPTTFIGTDRSEELSMRFSFLTGMPLAGAVLSRPSLSEGKKLVELLAPPYYPKPVLEDLRNDKPFLVLYTKEPLQPAEAALWARARVLVDRDSFAIGSLPLEALLDYDPAAYLSEYQRVEAGGQKDAATGWFTTDSTAYCFYNSFDDRPVAPNYRGGGAFRGNKDQRHELFRTTPGDLSPGTEYELSFWYYNEGYDQSYNSMWVEERDPQDSIVATTRFDPILANISDGNWLFNRLDFEVQDRSHRIILFSEGRRLFAPWICIDELLLRPRDVDLYNLQDSVLFRNNEYIDLRRATPPE